jgi:hypothetical protein
MENKSKEYGKLTVEQFKQLIRKLPELRREQGEFEEAVKVASNKRLDELLVKDYAWAPTYEWPLIEHIAWLVLALDKHEFLHQAVQSEDPQQVVLDDFEKDLPDDWTGRYQGLFKEQDVIGLVVALQKSILSIMIYQKSLSALVAEVREGNDDALFNAVRIDRTITACPTIADRIAKAELLSDKLFFIRLRNAYKGLSRKHWQAYQDLRYALAVLRELGFDQLSDDQLENLLVHQLKVYPNTFNARRNLRKQYASSKKIKHFK